MVELRKIRFQTIAPQLQRQSQIKMHDIPYGNQKVYRPESKEKEIRKLIEANGNILYTILSLKSANHLGIKLLTEDSAKYCSKASQEEPTYVGSEYF